MLEIYLTGIKSQSGVTFISGGIAATMQGLGYSTAVYLPVQTGAGIKGGLIQAPDMMFSKFMDKNITTYCSYLYRGKPLSPAVCEREKLYIDKNIIFQDYMNVVNNYECVIVLGQSNFATMFEPDFTEEELLRTINSPIVLVASMKNSTPEEIFDYLNFAKRKNLNLRGIILNEYPMDKLSGEAKDLQREIYNRTGVGVLGIIPHIDDLHTLRPEDWIEYVICRTDIEAIFNVSISKLHATA